MAKITLDDVRKNKDFAALIDRANFNLEKNGLHRTWHSSRRLCVKNYRQYP